MKHIEISQEIMSKVRNREIHAKRLERCLEVGICPKCGEELKDETRWVDNYILIKYSCISCGFMMNT